MDRTLLRTRGGRQKPLRAELNASGCVYDALAVTVKSIGYTVSPRCVPLVFYVAFSGERDLRTPHSSTYILSTPCGVLNLIARDTSSQDLVLHALPGLTPQPTCTSTCDNTQQGIASHNCLIVVR